MDFDGDEVDTFLALCFSNVEAVSANVDLYQRQEEECETRPAVSAKKSVASLWQQSVSRDFADESSGSIELSAADRDRQPVLERDEESKCLVYVEAFKMDWPIWFPDGNLPNAFAKKQILPPIIDERGEEFAAVYLKRSLCQWTLVFNIANEAIRLNFLSELTADCLGLLLQCLRDLYTEIDTALVNAVRRCAPVNSNDLSTVAFGELPNYAPDDAWNDFVLRDMRDLQFFMRNMLTCFARQWSRSCGHVSRYSEVLTWLSDVSLAKPPNENRLRQRIDFVKNPIWKSVIPRLAAKIGGDEMSEMCEKWMKASLSFREMYDHEAPVSILYELLVCMASLLRLLTGEGSIGRKEAKLPESFRTSGLGTLLFLAPNIRCSQKVQNFCTTDLIGLTQHLLVDMQERRTEDWPSELRDLVPFVPRLESVLDMTSGEDLDGEILGRAMTALENMVTFSDTQRPGGQALVPFNSSGSELAGECMTVVEEWPDYFPDGQAFTTWHRLAKVSRRVPNPAGHTEEDFAFMWLSRSWQLYKVFNTFTSEILRLDYHCISHLSCLKIFLRQLEEFNEEVQIAMEIAAQTSNQQNCGTLMPSKLSKLSHLIVRCPNNYHWQDFCREDLRRLVDLADRALATIGDRLKRVNITDAGTKSIVDSWIRTCVRQGGSRMVLKQRPDEEFTDPPWLLDFGTWRILDEFVETLMGGDASPELREFIHRWVRDSVEFRPRYRILKPNDLDSISPLYDRLVEAVAAIALADLGLQGFKPRRGPNFIEPKELRLRYSDVIKHFCAEDSTMVARDIICAITLIVKKAKASKTLPRKGSFTVQSLGEKLKKFRFLPEIRELMSRYKGELDRIPVGVGTDVRLLEQVVNKIMDNDLAQRRIAKRMTSNRTTVERHRSSGAGSIPGPEVPDQQGDARKPKNAGSVAPLELNLDDSGEVIKRSSGKPVKRVAPMPKREAVSPAITPDSGFEYDRYIFRPPEYCDENGEPVARSLETFVKVKIAENCRKMKFMEKGPMTSALNGWFTEEAFFTRNYRSLADAAVKYISNPLRDDLDVQCLDLVIKAYFHQISILDTLKREVQQPHSNRDALIKAKAYAPMKALVSKVTNVPSKAKQLILKRIVDLRAEMMTLCQDFCRKARHYMVRSELVDAALDQLDSQPKFKNLAARTEHEAPSPFVPSWLAIESVFLADLKDNCDDLKDYGLTPENVDFFLSQWVSVSKSVRKDAQKIAESRSSRADKFEGLYKFLQTAVFPAMLKLRKKQQTWVPPEAKVSDSNFFRKKPHKTFASLVPFVPNPPIFHFCLSDVSQLLDAVCQTMKVSFTEDAARACGSGYREIVRSGLQLYVEHFEPVKALHDRMNSIEEILSICAAPDLHDDDEPEILTPLQRVEEAVRIKREKSRSVSPVVPTCSSAGQPSSPVLVSTSGERDGQEFESVRSVDMTDLEIASATSGLATDAVAAPKGTVVNVYLESLMRQYVTPSLNNQATTSTEACVGLPTTAVSAGRDVSADAAGRDAFALPEKDVTSFEITVLESPAHGVDAKDSDIGAVPPKRAKLGAHMTKLYPGIDTPLGDEPSMSFSETEWDPTQSVDPGASASTAARVSEQETSAALRSPAPGNSDVDVHGPPSPTEDLEGAPVVSGYCAESHADVPESSVQAEGSGTSDDRTDDVSATEFLDYLEEPFSAYDELTDRGSIPKPDFQIDDPLSAVFSSDVESSSPQVLSTSPLMKQQAKSKCLLKRSRTTELSENSAHGSDSERRLSAAGSSADEAWPSISFAEPPCESFAEPLCEMDEAPIDDEPAEVPTDGRKSPNRQFSSEPVFPACSSLRSITSTIERMERRDPRHFDDSGIREQAINALNRLKEGRLGCQVDSLVAVDDVPLAQQAVTNSAMTSCEAEEVIVDDIAALGHAERGQSVEALSPQGAQLTDSSAGQTSAAPRSPSARSPSPTAGRVSPTPASFIPSRSGRAPKRPLAPARKPPSPLRQSSTSPNAADSMAPNRNRGISPSDRGTPSPYGQDEVPSPSPVSGQSGSGHNSVSPVPIQLCDVSPAARSGTSGSATDKRQKVIVKKLTARPSGSATSGTDVPDASVAPMPLMVAGVPIVNHPNAPAAARGDSGQRGISQGLIRPELAPLPTHFGIAVESSLRAPAPASSTNSGPRPAVRRALPQKWREKQQQYLAAAERKRLEPFRGDLVLGQAGPNAPFHRGPLSHGPVMSSGPVQRGEASTTDPRVKAALARKAEEESQRAHATDKRRLEKEIEQRDPEKIEKDLTEIARYRKFVDEKMVQDQMCREVCQIIGCNLLSDAESCSVLFSENGKHANCVVEKSEYLNEKSENLTAEKRVFKQGLEDLSASKEQRESIAKTLSLERKNLEQELSVCREVALAKATNAPFPVCLRVAQAIHRAHLPELQRRCGNPENQFSSINFDPERARRNVHLLDIQHRLERLGGRSETYDTSCQKILSLLKELIFSLSK